MVELDLSGVDAFLRSLETEQKSFNSQVNAKYRQWVSIIFHDMLDLTPQWSGNLTANWFINNTGPTGSEQTIPEKAQVFATAAGTEPHVRGDYDAIAISAARFDDLVFSYLQPVFIFNNANIAQQVEDHTVYIRRDNLVDGRVAMVVYAHDFYSVYNPLQ